jgi:3',5'-cyclic AMP phosphodiesterase CpdA
MLTILHISDLHFGPAYLPRVGEALLLAAEKLQPHIIVISGDFTQRAKIPEYQAAREYMERMARTAQLPGAVVPVPGNHDVPLYRVWERLTDPFGNYRKYISPDLDAVHRFETSAGDAVAAVIVALKSPAPYRATVNGRIRKDSLKFCKKAFADSPPAPQALRIVVAHHHFAPAPDYEGGDVMPKAKRAMDLFARLKVDMVLGGHLHRAYIGNSLDVYPGEERDQGIIIVQAGTATSRRGRAREAEKNSFNLIQSDGAMIEITHYMYFEGEEGSPSGFAPASRHIFPRPGLRYREQNDLKPSGTHLDERTEAAERNSNSPAPFAAIHR